MRMVTSFQRLVGTAPTGMSGTFIPAVGADGATGVVPSGMPGQQDNLLSQKSLSNQGWPSHRVAVAYKGPSGAQPLTGQLWVYDHLTESWYEVGPPTTLTPNRLTYFDVAAIVDKPPTNNDLSKPASQGNIEAQLVVQTVPSMPTGIHTFAMGADLTTLPV